MVRTVAFQAINVGSNPSRDIIKKKIMYLLIVGLPFLGSFSSLLFGFLIGSSGAVIITSSCLFMTLILSCVAFYEVGFAKSPCVFILSE